MDFWTVKNVTGRILVNLRWWSEIDDEGNETWVFESNDDENVKIGATDSFVFWTALYMTPVIWGFFALMDLLSFKFFWMNVCIICIVLSSANVVGFYKCQKDHYAKLNTYIKDQTMSMIMKGYMGSAAGGIKDILISRLPFFGSGSK